MTDEAITQADRECAADIWATYIAKVGEQIVEHQMRKGNLDDGLPSILAKHRTRSDIQVSNLVSAAQQVLDGLHRRIANSGASVPVLDGIADLHDALAAFQESSND